MKLKRAKRELNVSEANDQKDPEGDRYSDEAVVKMAVDAANKFCNIANVLKEAGNIEAGRNTTIMSLLADAVMDGYRAGYRAALPEGYRVVPKELFEWTLNNLREYLCQENEKQYRDRIDALLSAKGEE